MNQYGEDYFMESNSNKSEQPPKSKFKRFIDDASKAAKTIAGTPRVVKLIWKTQPRYALALVSLSVLKGVGPIVQLWIGKLIVDEITLSGIIAAFASVKIVPLLLASAGIELCMSILEPTFKYFDDQLSDLISRDVFKSIFDKANSLVDLTYFESSEFYDKLHKAANQAGYRPMHMLMELVEILRSGIGLLIVFTSFLILQPLLSLLIVVISIPKVMLQFKHNKESNALYRWETPEVRKMYYYRQVLTSKEYAPELRMFNLGDYFTDKYMKTCDGFLDEHKAVRIKHWRQNMLTGFLLSLADAGTYAYLALRAIAGSLTLGDFYFYSNALSRMQGHLWRLIWCISAIHEDNLFLENLFEFLDLKPIMVPADPAYALKAPRPIKRGIEFRNVSFRYAGSDKDVLKGLNFTLLPEQTVALVGENGAGKTTIVKLLGRLYDPSEGEILVDGINLKDVDLDSWRSQMSVIFQDFANYHLSAGENIGVGQVNFIDDEIKIKAAAERGGAAQMIEKLPDKYNTMLVKGFGADKETAIDLSGGEWQKMALSRAFMRAPQAEINGYDAAVEKHLKNGAAQFLVLDEPTSSLDVQSEHDIFLRFQELTRGKSTVLISHRFSTVRMANRILLLEEGKIAEEGSHEELMALSGIYAKLYKLQADKYIG